MFRLPVDGSFVINQITVPNTSITTMSEVVSVENIHPSQFGGLTIHPAACMKIIATAAIEAITT